jgi:anti-anti-sigma factor
MLGGGAFLRKEVAGLTPRPRVQPATSASGEQIRSYDLDGDVVVRAVGEIGGPSAPSFREELVAAIDRDPRHLVVDVSRATFVDPTGLDVLVGALRAADIIGGEVRLVGAGARWREQLARCGLDPVFVDGPTHDGVPGGAAMAASAGPPDDGRRQADGACTLDAETEESVLRAEIDRLRQTMRRRAVIDQAKGVLMAHYAVDDEQAFAQLRRWSQRSNTPLHKVADTLVNAICRGVRSPEYGSELVGWLEQQLGRGPSADGTGAETTDAGR